MPARALLAAGIVVALLVPAAPPAQAHPLPHAQAPRIVNPRPAPGAVVAPGATLVAALVASDQPLTSAQLRVDGQEVALDVPGGDHPTLGGTVDTAAGWHTVELEVANTAGADRRVWRFRGSDLAVTRLAGSGRMETAVAVSRARFPEAASAEAAVLARADDYPDALAGGPLAAATSAPMLLTARDELSGPSAAELERVLPAGATVYLLGGGAALSDAVRADVEARGFRVERLAGQSRYATAARIAERLADADAAMVVSGEGFADAVSASSAAARDGSPILLTRRDALPEETRTFLEQAGVGEVHVVGGAGVVGQGVVDALAATVGAGGVGRIAGVDRYATSAAVAGRFFPAPDGIAVASGRGFADALSGGPHAAARGAPLLLSDTTTLPAAPAAYVAATRPGAATVYGGGNALGATVTGDLRRATASGGGPELRAVAPGGARVASLDEVVLTFDRDLDLAASAVHVTVGDHEAAGTLATGDFPHTLVYTVTDLPATVTPGSVHDVRIVVAATDGQSWRHVERSLTLDRPRSTLSLGDQGGEVIRLQELLGANRFWVGPVDGVYGTLTHQAVMAVQKTHGLTPDGVYGPVTRGVLESGPAPPTPRTTTGLVYEVDLARGILMVVADGSVAYIMNTSAGHGRVYEFEGATFRADTTTGRHRVTRQIDGVREAARGRLWRPKYYDDSRGIAIHGSSSVPAHHASAGCIRLTNAAMDFLWQIDPGTGAGVWVYPESYY
ncbi:MAG: cell wall-binding repeat-containing protein [Egibacteraceae bacterium]